MRPTLLAAACLLFAAPAGAQGFIIPGPRPRPLPQPVHPLRIKSQKVTMDVNSGVYRVEVEQVFYNPNGFPMEGTYLFPLPEGATVSAFRMLMDKEPVDGKLLDAEEARRIYAAYVRRNVDPAILEYVGRNAFQARVFPIPASSERRIYLTYSQAADFSNGLYRVVYPLNSERVSGETAGDLSIHCRIAGKQSLRNIYSPSHEIHVRRDGPNRADVSFEGDDVRANRDFLLYYSVTDKTFGLNTVLHRRAGEDGYALLMLAPPTSVSQKDVLPKDVVLVFDTSGSMAGAKIEQARKAATTIIGALNDGDRFNVFRFSSDVSSFRSSLVPAVGANRDEAIKFVEGFRAVGGTAIDDALQAGLAAFPAAGEKGRAPYLIFMTDGLPTIGVTDATRILENAGKAIPAGLRLFSFGVGSDVNTLLLDRLSAQNRGVADYVRQGEDLEVRIGDFYTKIAQPVLANVRLTADGVSLLDLQPGRLPDLFAGTQILVAGRYRGSGKVSLSLEGQINGRLERHTFQAEFPERQLENDFAARLWAGRKIGFLLEEIRLKGENKELKDEVVRLSKEHGIVTPYTAYLVEEPGLLPPALQRPAAATTDRFFRGGAGAPSGPAPRKAVQDLEKSRQLAREQIGGFGLQTGPAAVESSLRLRQLKLQEQGQTEVDVEVQRAVAGRSFRRVQSQWVEDERPQKQQSRRVKVKHGSEAYHQIIAARADWARILSVGKQIVFRTGPSTLVSVDETGQEKFTDAELKGLSK